MIKKFILAIILSAAILSCSDNKTTAPASAPTIIPAINASCGDSDCIQ